MKKDYNSILVFVDVSFNILLAFIVLFALAFMSMQKKQKEDAKINSKAEFMVTIEWPDDRNDDVDSYMEDPVGNLVFFRRREQGLMHLDRDDLGHRNDTITLADGTRYTVKENKEIITIRGIIPGEYTVCVHMYVKKGDGECPVKIKMEKLNPKVTTVCARNVMLKQAGHERTAFRFTLDKKGNITETNQIEKALASDEVGSSTHDGSEYDYNDEGIDEDGDGFDDNTGEYLPEGE